DRVGLLNEGRLDQVGSAYDVYHHPANRFVAEFTGKADFLPATVCDGRLITSIGVFPATSPMPPGCERGELMVRPDDVVIVEDPHGPARITDVEFLGGNALYALVLEDGTRIHCLMSSTRLMREGSRVRVEADPAHLVFMPANAEDSTPHG
ncbi:MAG TPA: TOBE domain-containing protein, partial [Coriobacteriia bacterium]|nr:TOBE domain-containing protein [Coriobacteriia bacterium]